MTTTSKALSIAGSLAAGVMRSERARASVLSVLELAHASVAIISASGLLSGPVSRSGARSHAVWRAMLASRKFESAAFRLVASALYAKAAVDGGG